MSGATWTDEEMRSTVSAYLEMARHVRLGVSINKKAVYQSLAAEFGRTTKAFEYRMQNISYVLSLIERGWLAGLKPAAHVGPADVARIEALILDLEGSGSPGRATFEALVKEAYKRGFSSPPSGSAVPAKDVVAVARYKRDPLVKAWVLSQADGRCECCGEPAPFTGPNGLPFLEVHHVRTLAAGGSDTIDNAVAACPNCHRRLHLGIDAKDRVEQLYSAIAHLARE